MSDPRHEPLEWTELRISDSDFDAPEDAPFETRVRPGSGSGKQTVSGEQPADSPRAGFTLHTCASLAVAALILAAAGIGFAEHRGRTETSVRTAVVPLTGVDAAGCPRGDTCSALDGLYGGLSQAMNTDLPANVQLFATELIDNSANASTRRLRIVQLADSGIQVLAVSQCRPDHPTLKSWSTGLDGVGPKLAVLVTPTANGCSLALVANVPAAVPVPVSALHALPADPNAEGG